MNDRALVNQLNGHINDLKHNLTCGSTLSHLLWKRLGSIELMFDMLDEYTQRLQLKTKPNINDVEQTIRRIEADGEETPYLVVRKAILVLEAMLRTSQAIGELIDRESLTS